MTDELRQFPTAQAMTQTVLDIADVARQVRSATVNTPSRR